ncbi:MAG: aliphatic sulfonate ABC transporter substrate-binding protein [Ethanoligenens sp.]
MKHTVITKLLAVAVSATVAISFAGCAKSAGSSTSTQSSSSEDDKNVTISLGYQPGHPQAVVADQEGLFTKEFAKDGIKVDLKKFQSGPPLISAMTAGSVDLGDVGDQPAISAAANHVDLRMIGTYTKSDSYTGLVALPKSGINNLSDIKGKKIGVTIGSMGHQFLYIYLKAEHLQPTDIQIVNLQPGDIVSGLVSGNLDAAVTWEPYLSMAQSKAGAKLIANGKGYKHEVDVIIGRQSFLQAHPSLASRVLKVYNQAAQWVKANPDATAKLLGANAGVDSSVFVPILKAGNLDIVLRPEDIKSIKQSEQFLKQNDLIRQDVNIDKLIDSSYAKKAGLS